MVKRLVSFVIALALAGAPVALDACRIACEKTTPAVAHQSCHEMTDGQGLLSPDAPPCDHDDATVVPSVASARTADAALIGAGAAPAIEPFVFVRTARAVHFRQSALPDRLGIRLASPLRI